MKEFYSTKVLDLTQYPSIKTMFKHFDLYNREKHNYFVLKNWDTALDSIEKQYAQNPDSQ
jgi:hypothetical protein